MIAAPASLGRRFLAILYEVFPVAGLVWTSAFGYFAFEHALGVAHVRPVFQAFLVIVMGVYFVWQWVRGGQTLAMKAWRLKLVGVDGAPLTLGRAIFRYVIALAGTLLVGVTFLWGFIDRDRAFLHDRIAGTRIVKL